MRTRNLMRLSRSAAMRIILRDALLLVCLLAVCEVLLQLTSPRYASHLFDGEYTGWHPIDINEHGYRGPVVPIERSSPEEMRIIALGDSVTFGTGVALDDAWPSQLAGLLERRDTIPVKAINTGLPFVDVAQIQQMYENQWAEFKADVVVFAATGNMVSLGWIRRDEKVPPVENPFLDYQPPQSHVGRLKLQARRAAKAFALPSFLSLNTQRAMFWLGLLNHNVDALEPYGVLLAHAWQQNGLESGAADDAWIIFANDLASLRDAVEASGASFIATYTPSRFMLSNSFYDNEKAIPRHRLALDPVQRMEEICELLGIEYVNAQQAMQNYREKAGRHPLYNQFDYTHLDPTGHRVLAVALAERVDGSHNLLVDRREIEVASHQDDQPANID